jgi:hypothetical protein
MRIPESEAMDDEMTEATLDLPIEERDAKDMNQGSTEVRTSSIFLTQSWAKLQSENRILGF